MFYTSKNDAAIEKSSFKFLKKVTTSGVDKEVQKKEVSTSYSG